MENGNIETFKTQKGGYEIVHKAFITGRDAESLALEEKKEGLTEKQTNIESSHRAIQMIVVSVNGKTENVLDLVLDLPVADYTEVVEKLTEIASGKKNESNAPQTSSTS